MGAKKKASKGGKLKKALSSIGSKLKGAIGGKGKGGMRRSRKKSAMWYARAIQRIKLKRKYDKLRLGGL